MAYSQGGLIAATDYNNFLTGSNQLNTVWSTGSGDTGYGQSALSTVSAGGTVTATQWATLINTLNSALTHQAGSGSGISAVTAGSQINYLSTLATNINTAYTNRLNAASNGSTSTGTGYGANWTAGSTAAAEDYNFTRTVDFGSGDAARYFFNSGGKLNFVTTSCSNNDSSGRSADLSALVGTQLGSVNGYRAYANNGKSGTGGTVTTNNTGIGYWNTTVAEQTIAKITSTNYPYSGDYAAINVYSSARNASGNGDYGRYIYFKGYMHLGALQSDFGNKTVNVTWNHRIDVVYPESTNLSNSWGTPTIT